MRKNSIGPSSTTTRRAVIGGAAGLAGAAALGVVTPRPVFGQATAPRLDIETFAQDANRLAKFEAAVKQMKDRSKAKPSDPKGWLAVANTHRDFCSIAQTDPKQIHFCWWFLAWHRAYISVTERKIQNISGDPTFRYPYWNWSSDRRIPAAYAKSGSSLADAVRNTPARPARDGEVGFVPSDPKLKALGVAALASTFFEAQTANDIPFSFGGIARPNSSGQFGNNALEGTPHGTIHNYVGGDMSDFTTAGRDPIFFAHHGNLDRLWETWRRDPARKATEPKAAAFRNHTFVFTWLDGAPIHVAMSDILDTTKLGYTYDTLEVFRPNQPVAIVAQAAQDRLPPVASEKLDVPLSAQAANPDERKFLEISGVQAPPEPVNVGVYLKAADAPQGDPGLEVGSFSAVNTAGKVVWPSQRLVFDVTAAVRQFSGRQITVELVPHRLGSGPDKTYAPLKYERMQIITRDR